MKILLTGHKGFIGKNMLAYLENKGHEVTGFEVNHAEGGFPDVREMDLVIHLGAISSTMSKDIEAIMTQNYEFSYKLLVACNEANVPLQYASSASVYGRWMNDDTPWAFKEWDQGASDKSDVNIDPRTPYAWSKYLFDRLVENSLDKLQIKVQGFRYFNVYGEGDEHKGTQAFILNQWKDFPYIKLFEGSDEILRDWVHVDDVCKIHEEFFNIDKSGIFNLGSGEMRSFTEIAESTGKEIIYIPMPEQMKHTYQYRTQSCNIKLFEALGYEYKFQDVMKWWDSLQ